MSEIEKHSPLSVVAVVLVNKKEAMVLNRPLALTYERDGKDFIGSDGPFSSLLYYERGGGRFVAFAGRELALPMKDGTIEKVKDHWWSGSLKGRVSVVIGDVKSLTNCYVFSGGCSADPGALAELRAAYTGPVYEYWEYEDVLKGRNLLPRMEKAARAAVADTIEKAAKRHLQEMFALEVP